MYTENRRQYSWPGSAFFPRFLGNRTPLQRAWDGHSGCVLERSCAVTRPRLCRRAREQRKHHPTQAMRGVKRVSYQLRTSGAVIGLQSLRRFNRRFHNRSGNTSHICASTGVTCSCNLYSTVTRLSDTPITVPCLPTSAPLASRTKTTFCPTSMTSSSILWLARPCNSTSFNLDAFDRCSLHPKSTALYLYFGPSRPVTIGLIRSLIWIH